MRFSVLRPPLTPDELWHYVYALWGLMIPRVAVCPGHRAPFDAFSDAFFALYPVIVCKASRGFGGKTSLLGTLTLTEMVALDATVTLLGGSGVQSKRIQEESRKRWGWPGAPVDLLLTEPGAQTTRLRPRGTRLEGASATALMASQRSVRGPHPQRLRCDEIDEMDLPILDASLLQPMADKARGIPAQILLSSTHHHADGTFTEILRRSSEKGWPFYEWCYRETMEPHGWISAAEVARTRASMPDILWRTEVEGQEPTGEGRAILPEKVEAYFDRALGEAEGRDGEYCEFGAPVPYAIYATGADWGRKRHYTVIETFRVDVEPWALVAFERVQRKSWPDMIRRFCDRCRRYPGIGAHDATGLGDVNAHFLEAGVMAESIVLVGRARQDLFAEYVVGIEHGQLRAPRITFMYDEHRYCTRDDLEGGGHPPDSFVAGALAWSLRGRVPRGYLPEAHGERMAWRGPS